MDITYCINKDCKMANKCFRNIKNGNYPKYEGAKISAVNGCKDFELYWEKRGVVYEQHNNNNI